MSTQSASVAVPNAHAMSAAMNAPTSGTGAPDFHRSRLARTKRVARWAPASVGAHVAPGYQPSARAADRGARTSPFSLALALCSALAPSQRAMFRT
jgi:hypothetical protein